MRSAPRSARSPLAFDGDLNASTDLHSEWMISSGVFARTGEGGSTPVERMQNAGFDFVGSSWAGENVAYASSRAPEGFADEVRLLHTNLINSSGHRANILNDTFREVGIGFETVGSAYVTQNFARTGSTLS
jgi:serralysin